jgi:hypothetical protein
VSLTSLLATHNMATAAIRSAFPNSGDQLWRGDLVEQYSFRSIVDADWMNDHLPNLACALLNADFDIQFELYLRAQKKYEATPTVAMDAGEPIVECTASQALPGLTPEVQAAATPLFGRTCRAPLKTFVGRVKDLEEVLKADRAAEFEVILTIRLTKAQVVAQLRLLLPGDPCVRVRLFPEALLRDLGTTDPSALAALVCRDRRTCIFVVDMEGLIAGDLLILCGGEQVTLEQENRLKSALRSAPQGAVDQATESSQFLRERQVWRLSEPPPPPECFNLPADTGKPDTDVQSLVGAFNQVKALLSLAFIANRIQPSTGDGGTWLLEFHGQRHRRPTINEAARVAAETHHSAAYDLYEFACRGGKDVQLEIAQRMAAQVAGERGEALFTQAVEIREASEQALSDVMAARTREYFFARQNASDFVQKAAAETEEAARNLTRSAADLLFKVAGLIAAAVVAAAVNPELSDWAGFIACVTTLVYLILTIRYYCVPLADSAENLKAQYGEHIRGFSDVLGEKRTAALAADDRVWEAWDRYDAERRFAAIVLAVFGVVVAFGAGMFLLRLA